MRLTASLFVLAFAACGSRGDDRAGAVAAPDPDPVRTLAPAHYDLPIGTPHPFILRASAGNGRWLVGCQARSDTDGKRGIEVHRGGDAYEGDDLVPYLFRGGGAGEAIDGFVAGSNDDRWLVVIRDGALRLIDDVTGRERTLPDAALDVPQQVENRTLAMFLPDGSLAYFRYHAGVRQIVVRDLATQHERVLPLAVSVLEISRPDADGWSHVWLAPDLDRLPPTDTSPRAIRRRACVAEMSCVPGYSHAEHAWLHLASGRLDAAPSVLTHVMGRALVRTADRAIHFGDDVLIPARCNAHVAAIAAEPLRVFAVCATGADPETPVPLEIFGPGFHRILPDKLARSYSDDATYAQRGAFVCAHGTCYQMHDGEPTHLDGSPRGFSATHALLVRGRRQFFFRDRTTGAEQPFAIPGVEPSFPTFIGNPQLVIFGSHVVDRARLAILGELRPDRLTADETARSLVGTTPPDEIYPIVQGPLHWEPMRRTAL